MHFAKTQLCLADFCVFFDDFLILSLLNDLCWPLPDSSLAGRTHNIIYQQSSAISGGMSYPTPIQHPQNWPQAGTVTDMAPKNRHWLGSDSGVPRGWKNVWSGPGFGIDHVKHPIILSLNYFKVVSHRLFVRVHRPGNWFFKAKSELPGICFGVMLASSHMAATLRTAYWNQDTDSPILMLTHVSMEDGSNPKALSWIVSFAYCGAFHLLPRLWEEVAVSKQTLHSETCSEVPLHSKDAVSFNPTGPN